MTEYLKFEDWANEIENYSVRAERMPNDPEVLKWIKTAFEEGFKAGKSDKQKDVDSCQASWLKIFSRLYFLEKKYLPKNFNYYQDDDFLKTEAELNERKTSST